MHSFNELCKKISHDIDSKEIRTRSRTEKEQIRFDYAVKHQLKELWKKHFTHHDHESSIQKNKNYYFPQGQRLQNSPSNLIDIDLKWEINKRFKY